MLQPKLKTRTMSALDTTFNDTSRKRCGPKRSTVWSHRRRKCDIVFASCPSPALHAVRYTIDTTPDEAQGAKSREVEVAAASCAYSSDIRGPHQGSPGSAIAFAWPDTRRMACKSTGAADRPDGLKSGGLGLRQSVQIRRCCHSSSSGPRARSAATVTLRGKRTAPLLSGLAARVRAGDSSRRPSPGQRRLGRASACGAQ
jgi:hypothetical protein